MAHHQITLLRVQRLDRAFTLPHLSVSTGISVGRLLAIEEAWTAPSIEEVRRLAEALRIPIDALLTPPSTEVALVGLRPETEPRRRVRDRLP